MNAARIKGSHAAIKSGMLCAEALAEALAAGRAGDELTAYPEAFEKSWLNEELQQTRNWKLWFKKSPLLGQFMTEFEHWFLPKLGIKSPPWTLHNTKRDNETLLPAAQCKKIEYPKPDGVISFDRLSSVFMSNTNHEENEPCHLTLKDDTVPIRINLAEYEAPEQRYCPAGVYEIVRLADGSEPHLQINAQNCVHCKTCDIKDPTQNINWVTPQGGEGPLYGSM
jgi:electron-transferring-flavoprotein dehydrogenase